MDPSGYCHRKYGVVKVVRSRFAFPCVLAGFCAIPGYYALRSSDLLLRFAPLCLDLSSHPQNRTGSGDSLRLTMASFLTVRLSRFASAPFPLRLRAALASLQLYFRFASSPLLSQIFSQIKPSTD